MLLRKLKRYQLLLILSAVFFTFGSVAHPLLHTHDGCSGFSMSDAGQKETSGQWDSSHSHRALSLGKASFCPVCAGLFALADLPAASPEIHDFGIQTSSIPVSAVLPGSAAALPNSRGPPAGF